MEKQWIRQTIGALLGVSAAILILMIGFFKTLLIALMALAGWWLAGDRKIPGGIKRLIARVSGLEDEDVKSGSDGEGLDA